MTVGAVPSAPFPMPSHDPQPTLETLLERLGGLRSHYQPIVDLTTGRPVGFEALARFGAGVSPAAAFERARAAGRLLELEAAAVRAALAEGPAPADARLSINFSPSALNDAAVLGNLPADLSRIIVEVTENDLVTDDAVIGTALAALRRRGAMIAVDDAGAGYASFRQVLVLRPDIIKIDRSLVSGVHQDPAKAALVRAFVTLGRDLGSSVCAEGIEDAAELRALADLGVGSGQGYLFARPRPAWPTVDAGAARTCRVSHREALQGECRDPVRDGKATMESVGRALAACRSYDELDDSVDEIQRLLGVAEISVSRIVDDHGATGIVACAGARWQAEPVYRLDEFPATAAAIDEDRTLQVLVGDDDADPIERRLLQDNGYGALLLLPLRYHGVAVGTIEIFSREDRAWSRHQIMLARTIAHQLAMVLGHLEAARRARPGASTQDRDQAPSSSPGVTA
jgi:EAL domain-containing protein (putative c-di-GMP-specific phosphodiesterase class I)